MSAGVDIEQPNDRGHYPIDLATDPEVKALIQRSKKQTRCVGKNCNSSKFTFQNTQFLCTDCNRFFAKTCCIRYKVYESIDSQVMEKAICRCEDCLAKVQNSETRLKEAMETANFETVDKVYKQILEEEVDIDVKLKESAKVLHKRLEKELEIRKFIANVQHVDNYKTILKSVKLLNDLHKKAEAEGVQLDPYLVAEINQCTSRLNSERNLRFEMDNTEVPSCSHATVSELENLIKEAQQT